MILTELIRTTRAGIVVAVLATLALMLASCSGANPSASPTSGASVSINGSSEVASSAGTATATDPGPSASPAPIVTLAQSVSPSAPAASPGIAHQPQTIHLILHPSNDTEVRVGSLTGCAEATCRGDYRLGDDPLFDAATGVQVGTLVYVEFALTEAGLYYSPADTITLTGRGQIVFSETIYDDGTGNSVTGAITGGTDEFLGVTGYVTSTSLPGKGDFVITITG
jgi:hypothetical protein